MYLIVIAAQAVNAENIKKITVPHLFDHFLVLWTVKVLAGLLIHENVLVFNTYLM